MDIVDIIKIRNIVKHYKHDLKKDAETEAFQDNLYKLRCECETINKMIIDIYSTDLIHDFEEPVLIAMAHALQAVQNLQIEAQKFQIEVWAKGRLQRWEDFNTSLKNAIEKSNNPIRLEERLFIKHKKPSR